MNSLSDRHGGNIFGLSREMREHLLDFSANINPLGLSPKGKEALEAHWEEAVLRYPDADQRALKEALSRHYHMDENMISLGNGATELMYALMDTLAPGVVYVPAPSFSEYAYSARHSGARVIPFYLDPDRDFAFDGRRLAREMLPKSVVFLGHPNNPDGRFLSKEALLALLHSAAEKEAHVVVDESFIDFIEGDHSFREDVKHHEALVVLMSLTKFYAVPGLRIGCAFSSPALAEKMNSRMVPWHVNGLAPLYMTAALEDIQYQQASRTFCREERACLAEELAQIRGLSIFPGTVNFILCHLTGGVTGRELQDRLLLDGILIRRCQNYDGLDDSFIRVAVRTRSENERLIIALKKALGNTKETT